MSRAQMMRVVLVVALVLPAVGIVAAQQSENFELSWHVVSGGGGPTESDAVDIALNGTFGQAITGAGSGSGVSLHAGYWPGASVETNIYLPLIQSPNLTLKRLRPTQEGLDIKEGVR